MSLSIPGYGDVRQYEDEAQTDASLETLERALPSKPPTPAPEPDEPGPRGVEDLH